MKKLRLVGAASALLLSVSVLAGCSGTGKDEDSGSGGGGGGSHDYTYAVITHAAPGDAFWDRVKAGAERAGADYGVKVQYENDPDPAKQSQLIDNAVLLCSEATPHHCHRRLVAEYLLQHWGDISITHLV